MNITDKIIELGLPHEMEGDIMIQTEKLSMSGEGINSLNGFKQNGYLDLSNNQITSLDGFTQNGYLDLRCNRITSLDGFTRDKDSLVNLEINPIR